MEHYICIHGHFYQPPRENPWLESVELQHSAYPYHDWNERVTAECYSPNSTSRILNAKGQIIEIVNNYNKISFNFGPTLLSWMEVNSTEVYRLILEADSESRTRYSGHGSALAQAYNHLIMPLANRRDKITQVFWGIKDFEKRYKRPPEGMWLPETAVDLETLDVMAEMGLKFTVLAPHQAKQVRELNSKVWKDVSNSRIDPSTAYEVHLASGRKICAFFYDGPISNAVAFERLLSSGENLAGRLLGGFTDQRNQPQVIHIATDGETYGHHHPNGDMALAYALNYIENQKSVKLTNYGEFLEKYPPTHEVEIFENTSWSCIHGIERWRANCGCNTGGHPEWNQEWRAPLRQAMDWLRDTLNLKYEQLACKFFKDPWNARDDYIKVILDRSPDNLWKFFAVQAVKDLKQEEVIVALKLMELQRHAMLMYTSCGWFFDELSGIETVQVIQYAGRVVQLMQELLGDGTEENFLKLLEKAKSNIPEQVDGHRIYESYVKTAEVDLNKVAAHFAISSLFEKYPEQPRIFCYSVDEKITQDIVCGKTKGIVGRARFTSKITEESDVISYGVLHFGDHNINAGVRKYKGKEAYEEMLQEIAYSCSSADFPGTVRVLDKHFGPSIYSLKSLFRDEQTKVLDSVLKSMLSEAEAGYRQIYQSHFPLMRFITDLGTQLPSALKPASEFILNTDLRQALSTANPDFEAIKEMLDDARAWNIPLDNEGLAHIFRQTLENKMGAFLAKTDDPDQLIQMESLVDFIRILPFTVNIRQIQNSYYKLLKELQNVPGTGEAQTKKKDWMDHFVALGQKLTIEVNPLFVKS